VLTTRIAIDKGSDKWNGRSTLQSCAVQCESQENGPIVHSGIEKKNEKLSVCNNNFVRFISKLVNIHVSTCHLGNCDQIYVADLPSNTSLGAPCVCVKYFANLFSNIQ